MMDEDRGRVKELVREKLLEAMPRGFGHKGEECFDEIYGRTIEPALAGGSSFEKDRDFLLRCAGWIGQCAQKNAGENPVTWTHLAKAGNCIVPILRVVCQEDFPVATKEVRGEYCRVYEDVEDPPTG